MKRISEVFSDYRTEGRIGSATVEAVLVSEKAKTLEMKIHSDQHIDAKEIESLEAYIKEKFALNNAKVIAEHASGGSKRPLEEELNRIVCSMAEEYPVLKSMLNNYDFEVSGRSIHFKCKVVISGLIQSMGYDKKISQILSELYGVEYKVTFIDDLDNGELERLQEDIRAQEMLLIQNTVMAAPDSHTGRQSEKPAGFGQQAQDSNGKKNSSALIYGRSANIKDPVIRIADITLDEGRAAIEGEISNIETRELRSGKILVSFDLYDGSSSMTCKAFLKPGEDHEVVSRLNKANGIKVVGNVGYNKFSGETEMTANTIIETEGMKRVVRLDYAEVKRVELHMHTQMSQMDAVTSAEALIKRAMSWGMKSIAITDHGVVQAFPEAHKLLGRDNKDIKVLYGMEAYLVPDKKNLYSPNGQ
jgi:DNA polymerase-3 subunit alpha (Gram-positive type)